MARPRHTRSIEEAMAMSEMGPIILKADTWRTLETVWGKVPSIRHVFRFPSGVKLRVRYGAGWFSVSRQKKTTDGVNDKTLSVSGWVGRARFQAKASKEVQLVWTRFP
ncbi:hypothetical protein [Agromyces tropicus]